jgi:RNA polymerase sigma factor (TIGR02999 family)
MDGNAGDITILLRQWATGDREAESMLFRLLMPELRKIAGHCFRGECPDHTLQPTVLVDEAFLKLTRMKKIEWADRRHFLALAARIMRHSLIDHARTRPSVKFQPIEGLPEAVLGGYTPLQQVIAVNALLDQLEAESPQRCQVVELKFFLGLTDSEAAETLGLKLHTLQREWHRARVWLFEQLRAKSRKTAWNPTSA